jgi:hypothetical protein
MEGSIAESHVVKNTPKTDVVIRQPESPNESLKFVRTNHHSFKHTRSYSTSSLSPSSSLDDDKTQKHQETMTDSFSSRSSCQLIKTPSDGIIPTIVIQRKTDIENGYDSENLLSALRDEGNEKWSPNVRSSGIILQSHTSNFASPIEDETGDWIGVFFEPNIVV